ncbi:MAG: Hpt domain-containing protein [Magnetococcus sp. WYHC-3]
MKEIDLSDLITDEDMKQFRVDAQENLNDLEESLLQLESTPGDKELVGRVFRAMHTIKGTASMYGFEEASAFTHKIENYYDRVRNDRARLNKDVIDLTLAARDQLLAMLMESGKGSDPGEVSRITAAFAALTADTPPPGGHSVATDSARNTPFQNRQWTDEHP